MGALVPVLTADTPEARALWRARLSGNPPNAPLLFNVLKPGLLSVLGGGSFSDQQAHDVARHLLTPAFLARGPEGASFEIEAREVRTALAQGSLALRRNASWLLWRWMANEQGDRAQLWNEQIGPFFREIWPLDSASRDPATSKNLVSMALECGDAFPDAVQAIVDVLVPYELWTIDIALVGDDRHRELISRHPDAFLRLLNAIVDPAQARPPRDLAEALQTLLTAEPNLAASADYRRLNGIARGLSS